MHTTTDLPARFVVKIDVDPSGCWLWTGKIDRDGYGYVKWEKQWRSAHRIVYWLTHATLPPELDHLCRVRNCVNPVHLEPVTHQENQRRAAVARRQGDEFYGTYEDGGKWVARMSRGERLLNLGRYETRAEAAAAYRGAEIAFREQEKELQNG